MPKTFADMIGATYANKLTTLQILCTYILELRTEIKSLRKDLERVKTMVGLEIMTEHQGADEGKQLVERLLGGESKK